MANIDGINGSRPAIMPVQSMDESTRPQAGDRFSAIVVEVENGRDALIRFGQSRAYARLPAPVTGGQEIQINVVPDGKGGVRLMMMPPADGSAYSFSGQWEIDPFEILSGKADGAFLQSLTPGAILEARVTGFEKNGQTLMDFGSFKVFAQIDGPVHQGQHLTLTVTQIDPNLALRVVDPQSVNTAPGSDAARAQVFTASEIKALQEAIGALFRNPASSDLVRSAISNLQTLLTPLPMSDDTPALMRGIQNLIENSGLYFEKKLETLIHAHQTAPSSTALSQDAAVRALMTGDMKPNLLILKQFLDVEMSVVKRSEHTFLETLKDVVNRTLASMDQQQQAAVQKPMDPTGFQAFSHLLVLPDARQNARLRVYYAKKGADPENRTPRISLLLDMSRMGAVRSDLWMVEKNLNVSFFVENDQVKTAIEKAILPVKTKLSQAFNTVAIHIMVSEKKIEAFDREEIFDTPHRQVDLTV